MQNNGGICTRITEISHQPEKSDMPSCAVPSGRAMSAECADDAARHVVLVE